ncbi:MULTISPECIES: DNA-directed RNA polymerase subunit alpha [unclassified Nitratiruptor]|uniref:DNA-directed RNA polymerase subunit alpha n=1 Tax=unclassified Nitratiruptor TaxID=2624044 RepID=UPI001915BBD2|nr:MULTISPECIES: DNA-directed RNA polymerase subunit alpha [unclassified Nitratiruptor]BCD59518.1 DNA-directed RNA polymerase subunit alpha [Nitratiruptor sp. YY08-10]BCD63442.1 DNA-directed RNA polymerase subunit alpha [Nitratiruptor sp. YY08-14]
MNKIKITPSVPTHMDVEKVKENAIRLHVYPYESGYAISVAHPLRRLLLSSTAGYAPIGLKIEGVQHEFDSVRGMLEDVAAFIINLKNVRFKLRDSEQESITLEYEFNGPKELYGKDFENELVEVVTPDAFLATLNEDAELKISIIVQKGIGYVPSEMIRDLLPQGYIPLDAFFTPVKKAVYEIEKVLVEDNPNYEKIVFDIETDGQVDPVTALKMAMNVMQSQMEIFTKDIEVTETSGQDIENSDIFYQPLDTLDLSARSYNCLDKAGIKYVGELLLMSSEALKSIKNLGKKSLDEIQEKLSELNVDITKLSEKEKESILKKIEQNKS